MKCLNMVVMEDPTEKIAFEPRDNAKGVALSLWGIHHPKEMRGHTVPG